MQRCSGMIDWVTALLPLDWEKPLNGGKIVRTDENDKEELVVIRRRNLGGAYDATFGARTIETKEGEKFLELSGNPIKYFQGHNLFGTNKLVPLVLRLAGLVATMSGNEPTEQNLKDWESGNWTTSRLDVTEMIKLGSRREVRNVLHALRSSATVLHRGAGHWHDGTLYFGKGSKGKRAPAWSLKMYCKGDELELDEVPTDEEIITKDLHYRPKWGGNLPRSIREREKLCEYADDALRIELTLRTKEMKKIGLYSGLNRTDTVLEEFFKTYLSRMQISKPVTDAIVNIEGLPIGAQRTLSDWLRGADIRAYMNRQTLYRHRKQILERTGLDIATTPLTDPPTINLQELLIDNFQPEPIPDWAVASRLVMLP
jgi:hypothetical protein